MSKTILEIEESIQNDIEALRSLPSSQKLSTIIQFLAPDGYHPVVELQEDGRKKRRTAAIDNWTPETGEILISFTRDEPTAKPSAQQTISASTTRHVPGPKAHLAATQPALSPDISIRAVEELCSVLEEAEREGLAFIALKRFRDRILPTKGFAWARNDDERQAVLAKAVEIGAVLTSKIANPRSPFPTTTIRLNRSRAAAPRERRFNPIRIQGEPLSATILRDRGQR
ncbi:MAG: hypothetical protein WBD10_05865 [Acidobacteriaceae bacterium]